MILTRIASKFTNHPRFLKETVHMSTYPSICVGTIYGVISFINDDWKVEENISYPMFACATAGAFVCGFASFGTSLVGFACARVVTRNPKLIVTTTYAAGLTPLLAILPRKLWDKIPV